VTALVKKGTFEDLSNYVLASRLEEFGKMICLVKSRMERQKI